MCVMELIKRPRRLRNSQEQCRQLFHCCYFKNQLTNRLRFQLCYKSQDLLLMSVLHIYLIIIILILFTLHRLSQQLFH